MDDRAWVVHREALGGEYYRLRLRAARPFDAVPGQFVMVKVSDGIEPLLRRPFSIHRMADRAAGEFELLFRLVGSGTRGLAHTNVGDRVGILAPLGRGFELRSGRALLVGGGVGVAPLLFLAETLLERGADARLLLGGRADRDILCHDDFHCLSIPCRLATEDGSLGEPGRVTRLLEAELAQEHEGASTTVYACGPEPMLAAVARLCATAGVECQVSMEAHMACGVGACLGCVVPAPAEQYLRVCREGPVFRAEQLDWSRVGRRP